MNTKLHAICDSQGRPLSLFVTAGQVSDYIGARALLSSLPKVDWLLGDRGYDADWFREALKDKGIRACIPGRKQRKKAVKYPSRDIPAECTAGQWTNADTNGATGSRSCSAG
jgi:transposase